MKDTIVQLQQIRGVGEVLARRLIEAGFDTLAKVAAAAEHELVAIKGLLPGAVAAIQEQARALTTGEEPPVSEESLTRMLEDTERLRMGMASLVMQLRDQHPEDDDGKAQRALRKEISRVLATLERVEASLSEQLRRLGKKLAKADAKLTGVPQGDIAALTKGLRSTRKAISKIVR